MTRDMRCFYRPSRETPSTVCDDLRNRSLSVLPYLHAPKVAWIGVIASAALAGAALILWNSQRGPLAGSSPVHAAGTDTSRRPTDESPPRTFVEHLPTGLSVEPLLREAQRHAAAENVVLSSVDANAVIPTFESLAQLHLTLVLRGRYTGIKATLAQVLARHPNLIVYRLQMRQGTAPGELEASVAVVLLGQPLATPSVDGEKR